MAFNNICYAIGIVGGCLLIVGALKTRKRLSRQSTARSLVVAGGLGLVWGIFGEFMCWSTLIPQWFYSLKMLIGGVAAGMLINMFISGEITEVDRLFFRKRSNDSESGSEAL
jgi:hypothetical protein